jgi:glycosyltransferase involved in cell wall biosynthesis
MENFKKRLIIFMPSIDGGGVEKNLFIISNYLSKKIDNITLITFDNRFNRNFDKKIKILNIVKNPKKNYSKYYKYYKCLLLLTLEVIKKQSLVFAFQANIYCCLLSLILRFDLVTRSNSSPTGWNKNLIKSLIFKFLFKIPKKIIVNSKDFKNEIDKKFKINSKLIYNPLNLTEIKRQSKSKTDLNFFNNTKIKAINVARFTDQKDHITLLKSILILVKKNFKIKLLIIGYGPNKSKMLNFIKKNKLKKNVKIINFQKNPYKFMMKSNLFILSSLYEGLPNVLLESMALKKSIISSNCPTGPREILKKGKLGMLYPPQNERVLAKKIIAFNNNPKKFSIIADYAFKSLKRFDYDYNCEKYFQLIRKHIS